MMYKNHTISVRCRSHDHRCSGCRHSMSLHQCCSCGKSGGKNLKSMTEYIVKKKNDVRKAYHTLHFSTFSVIIAVAIVVMAEWVVGGDSLRSSS